MNEYLTRSLVAGGWFLTVMRKKIKYLVVVLAAMVALSVGGRWIYVNYVQNPAAHCVGCTTFVRSAFHFHAEEHDGWYPRGGRDSLDSLTQLLKYNDIVGHFTTHAFAREFEAHYEASGTFSKDLCSYRYNEGLHSGDPEDLIVIYFHEPSRWRSRNKRESFTGRQVLAPSSWYWEFVPEDEFQKRQAKTLRFLEQRKTKGGS